MRGPTHPCPAPDCIVQVPQSQLACRAHWYSIPVEIRSRVWSGYRSNDVTGHTQATEDAIAFLKAAAAA